MFIKNPGPPYSIGTTACGALAEMVVDAIGWDVDEKTGEPIPCGPLWKDLTEAERRKYKHAVINYCLKSETPGTGTFANALIEKIDELYARTALDDLVLLNYTAYKHPHTKM
jgi:hypothetical protein